MLIAALMILLRPAPAEEERAQIAPLVETVAFEASSGEIPVIGSGTVQARDEVTVTVQVSGRLTYIHPAFREGGIVQSGATLLRIDETDYRNDVRIAEADVAAQDVAVLQAEQEVEIARDELARFAQRGAQGGVDTSTAILPPRSLETGGEANLSSSNADMPDTQTAPGLATREPQLRSAQAARERAAAGLADAELFLSRTRVRSPFRGLVRSADAVVGSLVQPGQVLGSIVSTSSYEVRVSLTADEAALIPGLLEDNRSRIPASVTFEYGGKTYRWPAYVDRANAILDAATRNIEVFLRVPAPLSGGVPVSGEENGGEVPPLLLGAFVSAQITGASVEPYAVVPALAVRPGNQIWVVRGETLSILPVRVIQRTDELAYVTTPSLEEGGLIVVSSLRAPIDGMAVRLAGPASE